MDSFGFILLRHVNSELTNQYWIECYNRIRKFYQEKIVIVDDNSNSNFITEYPTENCIVIQSEFPKRGELLPYYYLHKYKWFSQAMIIHDSAFIRDEINVPTIKTVRFLSYFEHMWDNIAGEKEFISLLNQKDNLLQLYDAKEKWKGCFGVMSIISLDFLTQIQDTFEFFRLLDVITDREKRMRLERIFALLCHALDSNLIKEPSLHGNKLILATYGFHNRDQHGEHKILKVLTGR